MLKRIIVLIFMAFSPMLIPALSGEDVPKVIILEDSGTFQNNPHRSAARIPLECYYDSNLNCVLVMSSNPIGSVEVELSNKTTGEWVDVTVQMNAGTQMLPCPGVEGYCTINFTLLNGKRYSGEFTL